MQEFHLLHQHILISSSGELFSPVGNVRLICQMRSELRFSYWAAIVSDVRAISRLVGDSSSSQRAQAVRYRLPDLKFEVVERLILAR
jgi:hypothetical protein